MTLPIAIILVALCAVFALLVTARPAAADRAGSYRLVEDVPYRSGDDLTDYMRDRCRLDVYHPTDAEGFATLVWFHAGGLTSGERWIPEGFKDRGIAVVSVDYRLSPHVRAPAYIDDAAAAVAWTLEHIGEYGGDPGKVFVTGHSAGGYLTSMIGLDKRWMAAHGADADDLAGLAPISGHAVTHFTVRSERGIEGTTVVCDELAPLYHVRGDAPPILLITGDAELELLGRHEENAYLWRMLKVVGHERAEHMQLDGFDHGAVAGPAQALVVDFVERTVRE
jgi:acetyl esterase/lipase